MVKIPNRWRRKFPPKVAPVPVASPEKPVKRASKKPSKEQSNG